MANDGLLGGIGQGLSNFTDTYLKVKNAKEDRKEKQATLLAGGLVKNQDGNYELSPELQTEQKAKGLDAQNTLDSYDPNSDTSSKSREFHKGLLNQVLGPGKGDGLITDDMSDNDIRKKYGAELGDVIKGTYSAKAAQIKGESFAGPRIEQNEFTRHKSAVNSVQEDQQTKALQNSYQSIQNALVEFKNAPSVQSFHTLQSTLRQNAGSANRSGVAERAQQYADSTGLKKDDIVQFITGSMQDVNLSDPKLVSAYMSVARGELGQKRQQATAQIDKKAGAFKSIYNKPSMKDYQQDFNNTVDAQKSQFAEDPSLLPPDPKQAGGLIQGTQGKEPYPVGTKAKSKTGVPIVYQGNGQWAPQ